VQESEKLVLKNQPDVKARIEKYKKLYKSIFSEDFNEEIPTKVIDNSVIESNESDIKLIKQKVNKDQTIVENLDDFIALRDNLQSLQTTETLVGIMNVISDYESIIHEFKVFKQYDLSESDQEAIVKSINFDKEADLLEKNKITIEKDKINVETIKENVSKEKKKLLNRLFENPLIKRIYEEINPHFRFNTIELKNHESGKKNYNYIKTGDIHLNQIFSSAQLNTIALSIFLGMGIPETGSKLEQLFLDDPIQSMDDLNVLALIDVLRSMVDIDGAKKIILSTHDDNFAKLLQIKMRNKNIKTINFKSYGDEGPVISMN